MADFLKRWHLNKNRKAEKELVHSLKGNTDMCVQRPWAKKELSVFEGKKESWIRVRNEDLNKEGRIGAETRFCRIL